MEEREADAVLAVLEGLHGVGAVRIGADGRLGQARGFLAAWFPSGDVAASLRVPAWERLGRAGAGKPGPVHSGALTLAGPDGAEQVLQGAIWRAGEGYLLVAERSDDDIEHLSRATIRLSKELAAARRDRDRSAEELKSSQERSRTANFVDRLTGLGNRRAFLQALNAEVARAGRYGIPLCLAVATIDGLEAISERFGGERAEDLLRCFARVVGNETRQTDHAGRFGDNRFALLLTQTPPEVATRVAERVRVAFAAASPGMVAARATASFGYGAWSAGEDAGAFLDRVEAALDRAIEGGGDRAVAG